MPTGGLGVRVCVHFTETFNYGFDYSEAVTATTAIRRGQLEEGQEEEEEGGEPVEEEGGGRREEGGGKRESTEGPQGLGSAAQRLCVARQRATALLEFEKKNTQFHTMITVGKTVETL